MIQPTQSWCALPRRTAKNKMAHFSRSPGFSGRRAARSLSWRFGPAIVSPCAISAGNNNTTHARVRKPPARTQNFLISFAPPTHSHGQSQLPLPPAFLFTRLHLTYFAHLLPSP
jgi:hypothetical protein